jgi:hypothetical protein
MQCVIRLTVFLCVLIGLLPAYGQPNKVQIRQTQINDPANGVDDQFGYSVAITGNLVAVGAPQFAGGASYAYLFMNEGSGWKQVARLDDGGGGDQFGWAVAASPNLVAVGNPHYGDGGAIFIFEKPQNGWTNMPPTAELTVPGTGLGLGGSLAISRDGTTIVAGVPGLNGEAGGTCVFVEPEGGWVSMTEPTAALTPTSGHEVGQSVAMSGDTIVVGENDSLTLASAYVFVKPAGGWVSTSQPNATLTASNEDNLDEFAVSVAISGNTVVVGSPFYPNGVGPGGAFVYVKPETGWQDMTQTAELGVPVTKTLELGTAVAVEGNVVLSGAPFDPIGHNNMQGAVFGYVKPTGGWADTSQPNGSVTGHDGGAMDRFGHSIAISGNSAVIGAPYHGGELQGAVYIFAMQ